MNANGPIIVIEDDLDDQELMTQAFNNLGYTNVLSFFNNGQEALDYLNKSEVIPFLILSDINMPKVDGFELRKKIRLDQRLEMKCIPYLFFTTASSQRAVIDAYSTSAQGFFVKENTMTGLEQTLDVIIKYWSKCASPNNF